MTTINHNDIPDDFMTSCYECSSLLINKSLIENFHICPKCGKTLKRASKDVINAICDKESFEELFVTDKIINTMDFIGYEDKIQGFKDKTGLDEAIKTGVCTVGGIRICLAIMDSSFLMGSMGQIVGDKLTCLFEYATENKLPLIAFTASGGARMQEGIISLMQMSKVVNALKKHHNAGLFYMPILANPTTGGVTASFAQLGDMIIAEPGALICFAGPRVIKNTINQELPEGFQTSEFQLEHGFLDAIVERQNQREFIIDTLRWVGIND